jgi:hypothetical protein
MHGLKNFQKMEERNPLILRDNGVLCLRPIVKNWNLGAINSLVRTFEKLSRQIEQSFFAIPVIKISTSFLVIAANCTPLATLLIPRNKISYKAYKETLDTRFVYAHSEMPSKF